MTGSQKCMKLCFKLVFLMQYKNLYFFTSQNVTFLTFFLTILNKPTNLHCFRASIQMLEIGPIELIWFLLHTLCTKVTT